MSIDTYAPKLSPMQPIPNKLHWWKYTILRRLLYYSELNLDSIKKVARSLEGRTLEQLRDIHKKEIGY